MALSSTGPKGQLTQTVLRTALLLNDCTITETAMQNYLCGRSSLVNTTRTGPYSKNVLIAQ